ncbi:MAG TPA: hypothetical protein VF584_02465 [Longimicrobium sp.]|jgi:hypothetical protein
MNRIGLAALDVAGDPDARILLYAEVEDALDHMILRYAPPGAEKLRCALEFHELADAVRDAWEHSREAGPRYRWRAMLFLVKDRKFRVQLLYDDEVDLGLSMYDKEDRLLAEHFPGTEVEPVELPGAVELTLDDRPFWKKLWG